MFCVEIKHKLVVVIVLVQVTKIPSYGTTVNVMSMVSCQKGPTHHAHAWQIGPFWQDTLNVCMPGTYATNHVWAHDWNLLNIHFAFVLILMNQSSHNYACTCHGNSAVVACTKLWSNCLYFSDAFWMRTIGNLFYQDFGLWAHEQFVKWPPEAPFTNSVYV